MKFAVVLAAAFLTIAHHDTKIKCCKYSNSDNIPKIFEFKSFNICSDKVKNSATIKIMDGCYQSKNIYIDSGNKEYSIQTRPDGANDQYRDFDRPKQSRTNLCEGSHVVTTITVAIILSSAAMCIFL